MAKEFAKSFYNSKAWRRCRDAYYTSQHGLCERCAGAGKVVHHRVWLTADNINDPNISLNFEHLELLCQTCHNQEHHATTSPVRSGLMFDANGNLIRA